MRTKMKDIMRYTLASLIAITSFGVAHADTKVGEFNITECRLNTDTKLALDFCQPSLLPYYKKFANYKPTFNKDYVLVVMRLKAKDVDNENVYNLVALNPKTKLIVPMPQAISTSDKPFPKLKYSVNSNKVCTTNQDTVLWGDGVNVGTYMHDTYQGNFCVAMYDSRNFSSDATEEWPTTNQSRPS